MTVSLLNANTATIGNLFTKINEIAVDVNTINSANSGVDATTFKSHPLSFFAQYATAMNANGSMTSTSVASSSTTSIGQANSFWVDITGTATISSFGAANPGTFRSGKFTGSATLVHNSTSLDLPGSANFTTVANDRYGAICTTSGNWRVLWLAKANGLSVTPPSWSNVTSTPTTISGYGILDSSVIPYVADSGTANHVVATFSPEINTLSAGRLISVKIAANNTGNSTIVVNAISSKSLLRSDGVNVQTNDLIANKNEILEYDGTAFRIVGNSPSMDIPMNPGGYLTLESGFVSSVFDLVAKTAIYYTPDVHSYCPLYTGMSWVNRNFTEKTLNLNATAHTTNGVYDVFMTLVNGMPEIVTGPRWRNGGYTITGVTGTTTVTVTSASHGLQNGDTVYVNGVQGITGVNGRWTVASVTSNTFVLSGATGSGTYYSGTGWFSSRGTGTGTTDLTRLNGIRVNANQITGTNGTTTYTIPANRATYLGTILIDTAAGQITCNRVSGQSRRWGVWNAYNRKLITLTVNDTTGSWTYSTGTWRCANGTNNNSAFFPIGLCEEIVTCKYSVFESIGNVYTAVGISNCSTTLPDGRLTEFWGNATITSSATMAAELELGPTLGTLYTCPMEFDGGTYSGGQYMSLIIQYRG